MGRRDSLRRRAFDQGLDLLPLLLKSDPKIALGLQAKPEFGIGVEGF